MLPPETIATIGPVPAFPVSAAASDKRSSAFGDDPGLLRHHAHRLLGLLQADDDCAVNHRLQSFPHAREQALSAGAVDERGFPVFENLRRTLGKRQRRRRGCLGFDTPNFDGRLQRFHGTAHAGNQTAAADGGNDGDRVRRIFENLESHGAVSRDEVMIIEGMHKRSGRLPG